VAQPPNNIAKNGPSEPRPPSSIPQAQPPKVEGPSSQPPKVEGPSEPPKREATPQSQPPKMEASRSEYQGKSVPVSAPNDNPFNQKSSHERSHQPSKKVEPKTLWFVYTTRITELPVEGNWTLAKIRRILWRDEFSFPHDVKNTDLRIFLGSEELNSEMTVDELSKQPGFFPKAMLKVQLSNSPPLPKGENAVSLDDEIRFMNEHWGKNNKIQGTSLDLQGRLLDWKNKPDPKTVRTPETLKQWFGMVKRKDNKSYEWKVTQLKSIRQECLYQGHSPRQLLEDVYTYSAQLAKENKDENELQKCEIALQTLAKSVK